MKKRYWDFMQQVRFAIFYLDLCADNAYKWDMFIKVISAIASSAGIAAWAIWNKFAFIWSLIIALSQVVNAVKRYLPYSIRLKNIEVSQRNLKLLYSKIEYHWLQVASGELTEIEINDLLYTFEKEYIEIESQCSKGSILLVKSKLEEKAKQQVDQYFKDNFGNESPMHDISN